ncbi:MAG: hypothetical protein ACTHW1_07795 [Ancrocorticia sp.]|uniref:hypothetical protein n=1 Tax=Ancrocorticia sp. TaxID=2593684 RepID=UPI003F9212DA
MSENLPAAPRAPREADEVLANLDEQDTDAQIGALGELLEDLTHKLGKAQG